GRDRERGGEREHDARVAEREEESDPERAPLLVEELARRAVDRGDVVDVERVAQAERVRERSEPGERGRASRVIDEEAPAEHVEEDDDGSESRQAAPLLVANTS